MGSCLGDCLSQFHCVAAASNMTTLVLENSGQLIQNDKHFQFLKSILEFWGYFIVACDVVRMEQMHPATRNRSILIAVKQQFVDSNVRPQWWVLPSLSPKAWEGSCETDWDHCPAHCSNFWIWLDQDYKLFNDVGMKSKPKSPPIRRRFANQDQQNSPQEVRWPSMGTNKTSRWNPCKSLEFWGSWCLHLVLTWCPIHCSGWDLTLSWLFRMGHCPLKQQTCLAHSWECYPWIPCLTGLLTAWNFKQHAFKRPQIQIHDAFIRHQEKCWIAPRIQVHEDQQCPGLLHLSDCDIECDFHEGMDLSQQGCDGGQVMTLSVSGPKNLQQGDVDNQKRVVTSRNRSKTKTKKWRTKRKL